MMLFHIHGARYEAFSLTSMPGTLGGPAGACMSIAYTPLGFCELDNLIRPLAAAMSGGCMDKIWTRDVLVAMQVPLDNGANRLWWCDLYSDDPMRAHLSK
jgi:hypothetical protein